MTDSFRSPIFKAPGLKIKPKKFFTDTDIKPGQEAELFGKLDELITVIRQDNQIEKEKLDIEKKEREREKREKRENRIENLGKFFRGAGANLKKAAAPMTGFFDSLKRFLFFTILGGLITPLYNFLTNPENKSKIEATAKFLKDWWPALAIAAGAFLVPFKGLIIGTIALATKGIVALGGLMLANPLLSAAVIGGIGAVYALLRKNDKDPLDPLDRSRRENENEYGGGFLQTEPFAGLFSGGGMHLGTDTVPAMLTPGEFIMSRGAVNKFGVDFMESVNAMGGGTNRPKYGLISGFSGGGAVQLIRDELDRRGIMDAKTRAMYLAQFKAESGFQNIAERGHSKSSAAHIRELFGPPNGPKIDMSDDELNKLKMNDKAFFDYMYGPYFGNNGEGYKYRGRGFIQLTGKDNYRHFGNKIGVDLVNNPDLLLDPEIGAKASFAFMEENVDKGALARGDLRAVTKSINGGYNHITQRGRYYDEFLPQEIEYLKTRSKTKDGVATSKPKVIPPNTQLFGPAFGDDTTAYAQSATTKLGKLGRFIFDATGARDLFHMIKDKLPVGTPNMPVSTETIILPTIKADVSGPKTEQVDNSIPEFEIASGVQMRGLVGKALGIDDLVGV